MIVVFQSVVVVAAAAGGETLLAPVFVPVDVAVVAVVAAPSCLYEPVASLWSRITQKKLSCFMGSALGRLFS